MHTFVHIISGFGVLQVPSVCLGFYCSFELQVEEPEILQWKAHKTATSDW